MIVGVYGSQHWFEVHHVQPGWGFDTEVHGRQLWSGGALTMK